MNATRRVAVIGGGWAGMACAMTLSRHPQLEVMLLEAAPHFGGRARGLDWSLPDGRRLRIDNGQHLAIGAYTDTMELLRAADAPPWDSRPLQWNGIDRDARVSQSWSVPDTAWPWRVLGAIVPGFGPRGWPMAWQVHMARCLARLSMNGWQTPREHPGAHDWLATLAMPDDLVAHFWRPFTEGALNTPLEEADTAVLCRVLKDSLGGPHGATRVLSPRSDLSHDGVDPLCRRLRENRVRLMTSARVTMVAVPSSRDIQLHVQHHGVTERLDVDQAVMALPWHASLALWRDSGLPDTPATQRWAQLHPSAITTVWIALDAAADQQLGRLPDWAVLNPQSGVPHLAQVAVRRGGVLALVISARAVDAEGRIRDQDAHDHRSPELHQQILTQLGIDISGLPQRWITEKRATWACRPGMTPAHDDERCGFTGVTGVWRCADDLEAGYPATIESAVRSGRRTATQLLQRIFQT